MALIDKDRKTYPAVNPRHGVLKGQAGARVAVELLRGAHRRYGPALLTDEQWEALRRGEDREFETRAVYPAIAIV